MAGKDADNVIFNNLARIWGIWQGVDLSDSKYCCNSITTCLTLNNRYFRHELNELLQYELFD